VLCCITTAFVGKYIYSRKVHRVSNTKVDAVETEKKESFHANFAQLITRDEKITVSVNDDYDKFLK